jgi:hypothetical protein
LICSITAGVPVVTLVVGLGHRQAVDVVAAPGEQPDDPRQHPALVVHQHRQGVGLLLVAARVLQIVGAVAARAALQGQGVHLTIPKIR